MACYTRFVRKGGQGGAAIVTHHPEKKISTDEWVMAVTSGKFTKALQDVNPHNKRGPWTVLCDGESFLKSKEGMKACKACKIKLWHVPPRSPDLNPVEHFWSWLRKEMRKRDLQDAMAKKPVLSRAAYKRRLQTVISSPKAKEVGRNCMNRSRKTCLIVQKRGGKGSGD